MHPPCAQIVDGLLERQMNGGAASSVGTFAIGRTRGVLRAFEAPEIPLTNAMRAPDASLSSAETKLADREKLILDPRNGDAEDDVSSPKQKSLLAIAGSLLAEISLTKLLIARMVSIVLPAADPGPRTARRERLGRRRLF